ncbi:MAG: 50S ribosomal protein L4 [Lentisphaerae bacterium]|jgi:large subunit ribosomal protein L4|nr:50S ribosomal protein L4 [Lentisphaerota bacterium]
MSTTIPIKTSSGADSGASYDIQDAWLERDRGEQAVKDSVVAFRARMRSGTAATKNRSLVAGSRAKPWRQKGTGRARVGTAQSPLWRGGGVIFGPQPRSYAKKTNHKVEKLALRRAFTARLDEGDVVLVESIDITEPKTKQMIAFLDAVGAGQNCMIVVDDYSENIDLAARNLPEAMVIKAASVNTYWMLLFKKVVITKAAMEILGQRLA